MDLRPTPTGQPVTRARSPQRAAALAIVGLALVGCGSPSQVGGEAPEGSTTVSPSNPDPADTNSHSEAGLVDLATQDLSGRTGVPADQITVTRNESVTWPDGSLGCPQPGMGYISVLSPGKLIVLEAAGKAYEYHAGRRGAPFLCEDPQPPLPSD